MFAVLAPPIVIGTILIPAVISSALAADEMWVAGGDYGPTSDAPSHGPVQLALQP